MTKYLLTAFLAVAGHVGANAQQGFIAAGGDATAGTGSVSYSIGQPVYQAVNNASAIIIEGLQQSDFFDTALPLSLLYFKAIANDNHTVTLQWATVSEFNTRYFTVERSRDAMHFNRLADVKAKGNSNTRVDYSAPDSHPYDGNSWYRLKMTDIDGSIQYSPVEKVNISAIHLPVTAGPNPAGEFVYILMNDTNPAGMQYRLTDLFGRKLSEGPLSGNGVQVDLSHLAPAIYILQVLQNGKAVETFKITRQ